MLSASMCHFYSGMPAHKRADALAAVSGWVVNALVLRDRFAVVCSERGVVRVVSLVADSAGFMTALDAAGLDGVYDGSMELDLSGEACAAVMADLVEVLEERGL